MTTEKITVKQSMATTDQPNIMALLSSRVKLRTAIATQIDLINDSVSSSAFNDVTEMNNMLQILVNRQQDFIRGHNAVTDLLDQESEEVKDLHANADDLENSADAAYQLGANWLASRPTTSSDQGDSSERDAEDVFESTDAATVLTEDQAGADSGARHKTKDQKTQEKRKDHRGRSDSSKSATRAIEELRDIVFSRRNEYDRVERECTHKEQQLEYLEKQRAIERQGFLEQISLLEKELSRCQTPRQLPDMSTPASHLGSKSVSWPKDNISSVLHVEPGRDRARAAGEKLKSVCKTVKSNVLAGKTVTMSDQLNVNSPNLDALSHDNSDMSDSSNAGGSLRGSVADGVYRRRAAPLVDLTDASEVSLLAGLVHQNNDLMQTYVDDAKTRADFHLDHQQIPKTKLKIFTGDPLDYWMFLKTFDDLVESSSMRPAKKLNVLISHCSDSVQKLLHGCQLITSSEGYQKARAILRAKFGNPFLICQAWKNRLASYNRVTSPDLLESYSEDLACCFNTLEEMGHVSELENSEFLSSVSSRLDNGLRAKWRKAHRAALKNNSSGKFKELVDLVSTASEELNDPVYNNTRLDQLLDSFSVAPLKTKSSKPQDASTNKHDLKRSKLTGASYMCDGMSVDDDEGQEFELQMQIMVSEVSAKKCQCCGQGHFTSECPDFISLTPPERLDLARKKRLCILCLNYGHFIGNCKMKWTCTSPGCVYRHHNLLHGAFSSNQSRVKPGLKSQQSADKGDSASTNQVSINTFEVERSVDIFKSITIKHAVLPIAPLIATFGKKEVMIYGLLDPGSTATVCTNRLVSMLGLQSKGWASLSINTMTGKATTKGQIYDMTVQGTSMSESWPVFDMVELEDLPISSAHITAAGDLKEHAHLSHLSLPTAEVQAVDILIGQDNAHLLKPKYTIDGKKLRDPFAVITPLGWTIYGLKQSAPGVSDKSVTLNYLTIMASEIMPTLEEQVARSWELDKVPEASTMSLENQAVVRMWDANIEVIDGYIHLPIPLKREKLNLPDNRAAVLARLQSLGKRLQKDRELHTKYTRAMAVNFDKGYAVRCTTPPVPGLSWYLTQLPVVHKRKEGVVRPVWNGGFVFKGVSLNDEVHQGPDMTNKITTVMMNFRLYEVAMMGDIRQMYNQVRVPTNQRDLMRFLYWEDGDPTKEVIDCCLTYHMFGGGWSPSVCTYALQKVIELLGLDPDGEIALTIKRAFYVDDCLKSVVDIETGIRIFTGVISSLGKFHFDFTKIVSNRSELTDAFPEDKRAPRAVDMDFEGGKVCVQHSLGQRWLPDEDVFIFVACFLANPATRREMLSTLSSLYDPLGLCSPFLVPAKRLLQELSKRGLSWDDKLPDDVLNQWARWVQDAAKISSFRIPRWLGLQAVDQQFCLMHFCDASEVAYGTVCYVCTVEDDLIQSSRILTSRCKLAPLKSQSIPRLELCAALLAARLDASVREFLEVQPVSSMFWSDSTLVLRYLTSEPSNFKTFVSNRVSAIQEVTQANQWRHIPGELNPADMLSRGIPVDELIGNDLWLSGPPYLRLPRSEWPAQPEFVLTEFPVDEVKRERAIYTVSTLPTELIQEKTDVPILANLVEQSWTDSSCWMDLIWKVSWLIKFARIWKNRALRGQLKFDLVISVQDRVDASSLIIRTTQDLYLKDKEKNSKTFKRLFPRLRDGTICIGGRLERSTFPSEFKQPYVLPPGNRPVDMFILHCHNEVFHAGVERTLMEVRKTAWLISGRKGVSTVLKTCFVCKKYKNKPMVQVMADLPPFRLKAGERPFSYIGVDFMGPLQVKIGRSLIKRYVCVIVCSVSRALHLEVAADLSTSGFLNAFNRFVARRGRPVRVLSDNGTNFVGAKAELDRETVFWNRDTTQTHWQDRGIVWSYNPPSASHFGGMWERHIRTIRSLLLCEAKGHTLSDDGLHTVICLVEQCLNSRPLTKMSDDPEDLSPLTPNHILMGEKVDAVKGVFCKSDSLRRTWKQGQHLADCFWKRWSSQYLSELQRRTKWLEVEENLRVGSLVLLVQDTMPRHQWPLALVKKVHAGHDGLVRAAEVKTAEGTYTRPIVKLILLEADLVDS